MELPPLLRPSYWLDSTPPPFLPHVDRALLVLFGVFLFVGIFGRLIALRHGWDKMVRRAIVRGSHALIVLGLLGLLLYFVSFERIPVFGARVGFLLWLALLAWYVWSVYRFVYREIPEMEKRRTEREAMNKWLPKAKT